MTRALVAYVEDPSRKRKREDEEEKQGGGDDESSEEEVGKRCFVGNLPPTTTREYVEKWLGKEHMEGVDTIKLAREARDRQTFKGYVFITYDTKAQADALVEKKHNSFWKQGEDRNDRSRKVNVQISPFFTKRGRCFWCGSKEHLTGNCGRNVTGHAGSMCYRCNQTGHLVKDCPKVALAKKNKDIKDKAQEEHQKKYFAAKREFGHDVAKTK